MSREIRESLDWYEKNAQAFEKIAVERANALLVDHRRVRDAAGDTGQYSVKPCLPVDLIGIYVLLPEKL